MLYVKLILDDCIDVMLDGYAVFLGDIDPLFIIDWSPRIIPNAHQEFDLAAASQCYCELALSLWTYDEREANYPSFYMMSPVGDAQK